MASITTEIASAVTSRIAIVNIADTSVETKVGRADGMTASVTPIVRSTAVTYRSAILHSAASTV